MYYSLSYVQECYSCACDLVDNCTGPWKGSENFLSVCVGVAFLSSFFFGVRDFTINTLHCFTERRKRICDNTIKKHFRKRTKNGKIQWRLSGYNERFDHEVLETILNGSYEALTSIKKDAAKFNNMGIRTSALFFFISTLLGVCGLVLLLKWEGSSSVHHHWNIGIVILLPLVMYIIILVFRYYTNNYRRQVKKIYKSLEKSRLLIENGDS